MQIFHAIPYYSSLYRFQTIAPKHMGTKPNRLLHEILLLVSKTALHFKFHAGLVQFYTTASLDCRSNYTPLHPNLWKDKHDSKEKFTLRSHSSVYNNRPLLNESKEPLESYTLWLPNTTYTISFII